ncbi:MAG: CAP domain-containing protein [Candidatus Parcubacteria bacterium]|nr:CAP domain-containing protein [Burkholderiales bacterium]
MFFWLLLLASCPSAAASAAVSDLYAEINRLRAGGGSCATKEILPPLKPEPKLERVASDLARGEKLPRSLEQAGYRAARTWALNLSGTGIGARAAGILAKPVHCPDLQQAAMTEIGIFQDARQLWIVMAAPFGSPIALSQQAAGRRVLELVNQARARPRRCGEKDFAAAAPLRWNGKLAEAARQHSEDMARHDYFNHRGRDGDGPAERVARAGYRYRIVAENIAAGQVRPEDAVAEWIKSPGHCANLMHPLVTEMGSAYAVDRASAMGVYWTQAFGVQR